MELHVALLFAGESNPSRAHAVVRIDPTGRASPINFVVRDQPPTMVLAPAATQANKRSGTNFVPSCSTW